MDLGFIEVAIGVAIMILASGYVKYVMGGSAARRQMISTQRTEREIAAAKSSTYTPNPQMTAKALETYERLAKEKLDVIKTALAMGYKDNEIAELDARLEKLVGRDKLEAILRGSGAEAMASADLVDTQLDREVERLQKIRDKER